LTWSFARKRSIVTRPLEKKRREGMRFVPIYFLCQSTFVCLTPLIVFRLIYLILIMYRDTFVNTCTMALNHAVDDTTNTMPTSVMLNLYKEMIKEPATPMYYIHVVKHVHIYRHIIIVRKHRTHTHTHVHTHI